MKTIKTQYLDFRFLPLISSSIGVGVGSDMQVAWMSRLRLPLERWGLSIGTGLSYGNYDENTAISNEGQRRFAHALWLDSELGIEFRSASGMQLRLYGGAGYMISAASCAGPGADCSAPVWTPYGGASVGYAF